MAVLPTIRRARQILNVCFAASIALGLWHAPSMAVASGAPGTAPVAAHHAGPHSVGRHEMGPHHAAAHQHSASTQDDHARQHGSAPKSPENCPLVSVTAPLPPASAQALPIVTAQLWPLQQSPLGSADLGTLDPPPRGRS